MSMYSITLILIYAHLFPSKEFYLTTKFIKLAVNLYANIIILSDFNMVLLLFFMIPLFRRKFNYSTLTQPPILKST